MLIPLAKAMTLLRMVGHNSRTSPADPHGSNSDLREHLVEWCFQADAIVRSLDWFQLGAERKLKSSRWSRPELREW